MPDRPSISANTRELTGKKVRRLRRDGLTPGIVYGTVVEEPVSVSLDTHELDRLYYLYGATTLVDVQVDGDEEYTVYIRNLQTNPVSRQLLHAELYAPDLNIAMTASVPLILIGESSASEGVVTQMLDFIVISGLPADLPSAIEVDISTLEEIDDLVAVGELAIADNLELITDPDEAIVRVIEVRAMAEDLEAEAAEEELEEGELPEGEEAETAEEGEAREEEAE